MSDFFSLNLLVAVATIALVAIGIPLIVVLIRILFILSAVRKIVSTVAEEGERVKAQFAEFRENIKSGVRSFDVYQMFFAVLARFFASVKKGKKKT